MLISMAYTKYFSFARVKIMYVNALRRKKLRNKRQTQLYVYVFYLLGETKKTMVQQSANTHPGYVVAAQVYAYLCYWLWHIK